MPALTSLLGGHAVPVATLHFLQRIVGVAACTSIAGLHKHTNDCVLPDCYCVIRVMASQHEQSCCTLIRFILKQFMGQAIITIYRVSTGPN